jgi:hypothetical protein
MKLSAEIVHKNDSRGQWYNFANISAEMLEKMLDSKSAETDE